MTSRWFLVVSFHAICFGICSCLVAALNNEAQLQYFGFDRFDGYLFGLWLHPSLGCRDA